MLINLLYSVESVISDCCYSVPKSCSILCDPVTCSMPGSPVLHYQTHVHWVGDAIQPSHPLSPSSPALNFSQHLSPPSPPAFSISQHQGLFQWVDSSHQVARVLELQLWHQSFQWVFRVDSLQIDWFDFLAVQETLKSLPQHHNSKASVPRSSVISCKLDLFSWLKEGGDLPER